MKKTIILLLTSCFIIKTYSQNNFKGIFYFSPGISFGYTFSAGINYGFEFDFGLLQYNTNDFPINSGISFSKYWTQTNDDTHRHRTINLLIESPVFDFNIGYGNVKNRWGYGGNRNECREGGLNLDLSLTANNFLIPWIGFKIFIYDKVHWAWYDKYYKSAYLKYKYDFLNNSEIKIP